MDAGFPVSRSHGTCAPACMDAAFPLLSSQLPPCGHADRITAPCGHADWITAPIDELQPPDLDEDFASGHDSSLEYINSMLMDEAFEDSSWQLLAHNAGGLAESEGGANGIGAETASLNDHYERIFRGFHEILDESIAKPAAYKSVEAMNLSGRELIASEVSLAEVRYDNFGPSLYLQVPEEHGFMDALQTPHMAEFTSNITIQRTDNLPAGPAAHQLYRQMLDPPPAANSHAARARPETQDVSLVQNVDLPAERYAHLFDEFPLLKDREFALSMVGHSNGHFLVEGRQDEALENPVDLKGLLLSSGKALGDGNVRQAMDYLQQIRQEGVSPHGSGLQRAVHYFSEALMARLSGMGNTLYKSIASTTQLPSPLMMIKAYKVMFDACPYVKVAYYFANQYILKAASGVPRLHIVDYGILYGFQWPCLIYALAHRYGGPPFLRITGIEFPASPADMNPKATTEGTNRRLREYAKTYNVPFEYHAVSSSKWEDVDAASLRISQDELLVINCFNRLGHVHDENFMHPSPRDQLLRRIRSLNPNLLVMGSINAAHSTPFFAPRFREAFYYYSNIFDMLHTTMPNNSPEREMLERELMGRSILNVVACEGVERAESPETYKQWQARMTRVGFQQLSVIPSVLNKSKAIMKSYHKDFSLLQDSNKWLLLGWRGRSVQALSAWKPDMD